MGIVPKPPTPRQPVFSPASGPKPLRPRQLAILEFVRGFVAQYGMFPMLLEIGAHCGLPSSIVHVQLAVLEQKGLIARRVVGTRSIRVLPAVEPPPAPTPDPGTSPKSKKPRAAAAQKVSGGGDATRS